VLSIIVSSTSKEVVRFGIFLNELLKLIYSWTVNKVRGSLSVSFFILVLQGTFAKCFPGVIYEERKLDLELFNQQVLAPLSDQLTEVRMIFFRVDLMSFSQDIQRSFKLNPVSQRNGLKLFSLISSQFPVERRHCAILDESLNVLKNSVEPTTKVTYLCKASRRFNFLTGFVYQHCRFFEDKIG
jgi:hypothetical protein